LAECHFRYQFFEANAMSSGGSGQAEIGVNDFNVVGRPAEFPRSLL